MILTAPASASELETLIDAAKTRGLAQAPYWRALLHCPAGDRPYESLVDDPKFFLSENGKTNAEEELVALLTTFYGEKKTKISPCRFIARLTWVHEELADLTNKECPRCPEADAIHPSSATLIFPTYHLNNPASMFGHTFLTVETDFKSPILSDAVNYAALPDSPNPIAYMTKGIFGYFPGYYTILPYYKKIREYGEMSQRDIWEYPLTLTPEETRRMVLHILEMRNIHTDYFFFDENCSYMLQFLLETARPEASLTGEKGLTVIPVDTIRNMKAAGFIKEGHYRPAIGTRITYALKTLSAQEREVVTSVVEGEIEPSAILTMEMEATKKRRLLNLVANVARYRLAKQELDRKAYLSLFLPTLKARKSLGKGTPDETHLPTPPNPLDGHEAARISLGVGTQDGHPFEEITLNPSFTTVLNADHTTREGIAIEFLTARARHDNDTGKTSLEAFSILDIVSLSPRNTFINPLSWTFHVGYEKQLVADESHKGVSLIKAATGFSWNTTEKSLFYAMPEAAGEASQHLDKGAAVSLGLRAGLLLFHSKSWRSLMEANASRRFPDDTNHSLLRVETNLKLSRNNRISFSATHTTADNANSHELTLSFHHYF